MYLSRAIQAFVMYCVNGTSRSSLLIESTDSMITGIIMRGYDEIRIIRFISSPITKWLLIGCVYPRMIAGSSKYPRNPRILRQGGGGGELCPSWDDPRIVRVSQESQDTQTGGGELCPSRDDPGIV